MDIGRIVKTSFWLMLAFTFIATYLKLTHAENADTWLSICFIPIIIFVLSSLYEIWNSKKINHSEKALWTVAFIFFYLTGIIYLLFGRKRIA